MKRAEDIQRRPMNRPDDIAFISNFPMPPPMSALTFNLISGGRAKSKQYVLYEKAVRFWMMTNNRELQIARAVTLKCSPGRFLHVDAMFHFHEKNILTKDGKPKRNDTSNRIKALHDVFSAILGIDDSWFWSFSGDKKCIHPDRLEHVEITMVVADPIVWGAAL